MTPTDLANLIANAPEGATLEIPADYVEPITVRRRTKALTLTGGGAIPYLYVLQCANVTFTDMAFKLQPDEMTTLGAQVCRIVQNVGGPITLDGCRIESGPAVNGVPPGTPTDDPSYKGIVQGVPIGCGVFCQSTDELVLTSCEISQVHKGIVPGGVKLLRAERCEIHHIRTSQISGVAHTVDLRTNYFHDSSPYRTGSKKDDHADFIHLWTGTYNAPGQPCPDYIIIGNLMDQGESYPLMGLYLDDNTTAVGFPNVTIRDNVVLSSHAQALLLEYPQGGVVLGNHLLQVSVPPWDFTATPSLQLRDRVGTLSKTLPGLTVGGNRGANVYGAFDPAHDLILPANAVRDPGEIDAVRYDWSRENAFPVQYPASPLVAPFADPDPASYDYDLTQYLGDPMSRPW